MNLTSLGNTVNTCTFVQNCVSKFKKYTNKNLTDGCKLDSDTFVTHIKDMTLNEYSVAVKINCENLHNVKSCSKCKPVLEAIAEICEKGIVPLSTLYRQCFGSVYKSDKAIRRIIQFPVIIFRCFSQLFVTEYVHGLNFAKLASCVAKYLPQSKICAGINKENLKLLCEMASSEKDKRLIRVASCQGMSGNEAKRLGVSNLNKEKMKVYEAMQDYLDIKQAVNKIAQAKVLSMEMESSGESMDEESSGESCIWISDDEEDEEDFVEQNMLVEQDMLEGQKTPANLKSPGLPSQNELIILLKDHKMNWLSFVEHLKLTVDNLSDESLDQLLKTLSCVIPYSNLTDIEKSNAAQSYQAYLIIKETPYAENSSVLTESESDNPENWGQIKINNHSIARSKGKDSKANSNFEKVQEETCCQGSCSPLSAQKENTK